MFDGRKIRLKRKELKLSAEKLGVILGVSKENIYKWEKGHKPHDPEEFIKVQSWLNGDDLTNNVDWRTKYYELLEKYTILLEKKKP